MVVVGCFVVVVVVGCFVVVVVVVVVAVVVVVVGSFVVVGTGQVPVLKLRSSIAIDIELSMDPVIKG